MAENQKLREEEDRDELHETVSPKSWNFFSMFVICIATILSIIPIFWPWCVRTFQQYERCVHFRLGRLQSKAKGPGLFFFLPLVDEVVKIDLRVDIMDVPAQNMITKDSVTVEVNAVVYFFVNDAIKAVTKVERYKQSTSELASTTLRSVVGDCELDEILSRREHINNKVRRILDEATDVWGIKVSAVEIKDVRVPQKMQRSMASQAEAERDRRAKVISAEGEWQASKMLTEAAAKLAGNPATIQLRYLQTLNQISIENNQTIVFPLPTEMIAGMGQPGGGAQMGNLMTNMMAMEGSAS